LATSKEIGSPMISMAENAGRESIRTMRRRSWCERRGPVLSFDERQLRSKRRIAWCRWPIRDDFARISRLRVCLSSDTGGRRRPPWVPPERGNDAESGGARRPVTQSQQPARQGGGNTLCRWAMAYAHKGYSAQSGPVADAPTSVPVRSSDLSRIQNGLSPRRVR